MLVYVSERLLLQHLTYKAQTLLVVPLQAFRSSGQERLLQGIFIETALCIHMGEADFCAPRLMPEDLSHFSHF